MRSTAPRFTGMHTAIPSSGADGAGIAHAVPPASPCCRGPHDFPDAPLSGLSGLALLPRKLDWEAYGKQARVNGHFPKRL